MTDSDSDVGSLFPFVESQVVKGEPVLSYLRPEFGDLRGWKKKARGRLLELLHYAPPRCDPRLELVSREDCSSLAGCGVYRGPWLRRGNSHDCVGWVR